MDFEVLQLFWSWTPQNEKAHSRCAFSRLVRVKSNKRSEIQRDIESSEAFDGGGIVEALDARRIRNVVIAEADAGQRACVHSEVRTRTDVSSESELHLSFLQAAEEVNLVIVRICAEVRIVYRCRGSRREKP